MVPLPTPHKVMIGQLRGMTSSFPLYTYPSHQKSYLASFSPLPERPRHGTTASIYDLTILQYHYDSSWQRAFMIDGLACSPSLLLALLVFNAMIPLSSTLPHSLLPRPFSSFANPGLLQAAFACFTQVCLRQISGVQQAFPPLFLEDKPRCEYLENCRSCWLDRS